MILGSFYFNRTANGNLIGEYINQASPRVVTESADFISEEPNGDLIYQSTWFDGSGQNMRLLIRPKPDSINIFRFTWSDGTTDHFVGEAFLNDHMFIGAYWDGRLNTRIENLLLRR